MRTLARALLAALFCQTPCLAQTMQAAGKLAAPRKPPPFSMRRPGAAPLPLIQYRGKIIVLTFISTVCSHCQDFTRAINPIAGRYSGRGVQFLECAINDGSEPDIERFVTQFQPAFPVGWATQEAMMSFLGVTPFLDPQALFVPHMVLLDRAGLLRRDIQPGSDFYKNPAVSVPAALEELLRQKR